MNFRKLQFLGTLFFAGFFCQTALFSQSGSESLQLREPEDFIRERLPKTYAKLKSREPIHILALGDGSVLPPITGDEDGKPYSPTFYAVLAEMLARHFLYGGGVKDISFASDSYKSSAIGLDDHLITVECGGFRAATAAVALHQFATSSARRSDLVILSFGARDILRRTPLAQFRNEAGAALRYLQKRGKDVIVCAPGVLPLHPREYFLGAGVVYAQTLEALALEHNALFVNLAGYNLESLGHGLSDEGKILDDFGEKLSSLFTLPFTSAQDESNPFSKDALNMFNDKAHEEMGVRMFNELLGQSSRAYPSGDLAMSARAILASSRKKIVLEYTLRNNGPIKYTGNFRPLAIGYNYLPKKTSFPYELEPGEEQTFKAEFGISKDKSWAQDFLHVGFPGEQIDVRLGKLQANYLIADNLFYDIGVAEAEVLPFYAEILQSSFFPKDGKIELSASIYNNDEKDLALDWLATWNGARNDGSLKVPAGDNKTISMRFSLPRNKDVDFIRDKLILSVKSKDKKIVFKQYIQARRNVPLEQPISLIGIGDYLDETSYPLILEKSVEKTPYLQLAANDKFLTISVDVPGAIEVAKERTLPIAYLRLGIDARSSKRRFKTGKIGGIEIVFWGDERGSLIKGSKLGSFGETYLRSFNSNSIKTHVRYHDDGVRLLVFFPRDAFYRHEWNFDSSNSRLGLNARLYLLDVKNDDYPKANQFFLNLNGFAPDDPRSTLGFSLSKEKKATQDSWQVYVF